MDEIKLDADDIFCDDPAAQAALDSFGIKYIYPWQRLVIANIIDAWNDACTYAEGETESEKDDINDNNGKQIVLLPTGAGKSLCFQIPAMLLKGPTLVIYPLLALMSDQYRRMKEGGMKAVIFRGGQTPEEREENFRQLNEGAKIIIANPEVLACPELTDRLCACGISHVAIDEAHCVSEWGDSFRPAYLELGAILKKLNIPVVTAFTATASPEVLARISDVLFDGQAHIVRSESDRPNIHYYVKKVFSKRQAALVLAKTEARPMIIFCNSRHRTEMMAQDLNVAYGPETARFYHAGLERSEKTKIEEWFFGRKDAVLCATCAYGMGVDKKDIHTVVHLDPPQTAEAYIQEAGRGGRDGSVANAILLWSDEDHNRTVEFADGSRKAALRQFAETTDCRRQVLLNALGAEQAVCDGCDICDGKKLADKRKVCTETAGASTSRESLFAKGLRFAGKVHHLQNRTMPGSQIPEDEVWAQAIIELSEHYFTQTKFESFLFDFLNRTTRPLTSVNIWEPEAIHQLVNHLISSNIIRICKWPWKNRLATVKK